MSWCSTALLERVEVNVGAAMFYKFGVSARGPDGHSRLHPRGLRPCKIGIGLSSTW